MYISDNENMTDKIIQLLNDAITPFLNQFSFKYDKKHVKMIYPVPESV